MNSNAREQEIQTAIAARIDSLRGLSIEQIEALPEANGEEVTVGGKKCALTTFVQRLSSDEVLVTVQFSKNSFLGIGTHTERGLVFSAKGYREASEIELQNSGG